MNVNDTIRLLIVHDSRNEAERLVSMLSNAGRATRAQYVESEEGLVKLLQEQVWDLLIAHSAAINVDSSATIRQIKRLNKDVPVILLTNQEGPQAVVDGLRLGAVDTVLLDQDQHLLLVMQRELANREQRKDKRKAERQFKEAEQRSQLLLDSSRDGIAYVQDGMYLYANQSYAEAFGYSDADDIDCMSIVDMVADEDQASIKQFLKNFSIKGDDAESCDFRFHGLREDGSPTAVKVSVANALYEDEYCIQFLIKAKQVNDEELEAELKKVKNQDLVTGLYNRLYLTEQLEHALSQSVDNETTSSLLYIEIDKFFKVIQEQVGVTGSDIVIADLADRIKSHCDSKQTLARFSDDAFMLLAPGKSADDALAQAEKIRQDINDHIIDVEGKTIQATVSVGVSLINETTSKADVVIDQSLRACESYNRTHDDEGNSVSLFEPEVVEGAEVVVDVAKMVQSALDNNNFKLLFQPIISLRGSEDGFYEVLLRMQGEDAEDISPNSFLESASEIGATTKIDRWVILESIKVLSKHRASGSKTRMLINISRDSLCDKTLIPWLAVAFKAAKIPTDSVVFQVSETDVTNYLNDAKAFFKGLSKIKCLSSISNFGCSLNPFNTLKHAPCDYVKVHGSFTMDIQNNNESPELLSKLISDLLELDKVTVVPFVENASVLSSLWQTGVHYIQGHYLQAPSSDMNYDFNMEE
jgi:diguanylate cyclase (GGDEF)-like protein/PAS domain S-box-containing protein